MLSPKFVTLAAIVVFATTVQGGEYNHALQDLLPHTD